MAMRWYYGWNVVVVGMVFQAMSFGLTLFMFTFWAEAWIEEFSVDRATITLAFMAFNLGMGAISPVAGRMLDERSIRGWVVGGACVLALGFVLVSMATAAWQIIALYATVVAAGTVLSGPLAASTLAAKWFRARRGMAIGVVSVGTSLGGLLLPPAATYLYLNLGWRQAHLVLAAVLVAVIAPLVLRVVRNSPEEHGIEPEPAGAGEVEDPAHSEAPLWTTRAVLAQRDFWVPVLAFLPMIMAFSIVQANLRLYAADIGIDPQSTAFLMSLLSATMIGGKLFFGAMADRWDQRALYWLAAATMAVAMVLLIGRPSFARMMLISGLLGLAAGGFLPLLGAIVGTRFGPQAFGRVFGLMAPFLTLSSLGPPIAGWVRDTTGSYDTAFQLILVTMVPAALVMVLMRPVPRFGQPAAGVGVIEDG
jgi:MFS family permease